MDVLLGIDTGGTYTDAVLVDHAKGRVLFSAKSLTTYDDLSRGIGLAVDAVLSQEGAPGPESITMTGLSTTLATNAIVEGRGGRVCLVLVGYDPDMIDSYGLRRELVVDDVVHLAGGHDSQGVEARPLDETGLRETALSRKDKVDAFGVSSYFGVRNPDHEARAAAILENISGLPVTCGHLLTSRLDSIRRATTVALNAGLIPLIKGLIDSVRQVLALRGIGGQLMVVKGDGSLVEASWAAQRPIETILSGPAASVVGARHLVREEEDGNFWVMDMGGTTTDIARLKHGQPRLNPQGAKVGPWRTMVEAVDIRTVGLGGDSKVELTPGRGMKLGPERIVPLCLAAQDHPEMIGELEKQKRRNTKSSLAAVFLLPQGGGTKRIDSPWEEGFLAALEKGPAAWDRLVEENGPASFLPGPVLRAAARRLIGISGFTPTDALHVLGRLDLWSSRAALAGAEVLSAQAGLTPQEFAQKVIEGVYAKGAEALALAALAGENPDCEESGQGSPDSLMLQKALSENGNHEADISVSLTLNHPVVANRRSGGSLRTGHGPKAFDQAPDSAQGRGSQCRGRGGGRGDRPLPGPDQAHGGKRRVQAPSAGGGPGFHGQGRGPGPGQGVDGSLDPGVGPPGRSRESRDIPGPPRPGSAHRRGRRGDALSGHRTDLHGRGAAQPCAELRGNPVPLVTESGWVTTTKQSRRGVRPSWAPGEKEVGG